MGISPLQGCYLHAKQHKQTSIPQVVFKPTIPVFEWVKTVRTLVHVATVIGMHLYIWAKTSNSCCLKFLFLSCSFIILHYI
jgi:hypothetical protein